MAKLKIVTDQYGRGDTVELDGEERDDISDVAVNWSADDVARATVTFVLEELHLEEAH